MNENEIIVHQCSSADEFQSLVHNAFRYSLVSLPFTVDRMRLKNIETRILNIYKGKLAEGLLKNYTEKTQLDLDFTSGETGFWTRDKFDFSFDGLEWDLKNNFTHNKAPLALGEYLNLPALVPNRHRDDQWQSALNEEKKGFVFSFMSQKDFPTARQIKLSGSQLDFIKNANPGEADLNQKPFEEAWFFSELDKRGRMPQINHKTIPTFYITAYCKPEHYSMFLDTDGVEHFNYAMYGGKWYVLDNKQRLCFRNGLIRTRIRNATCPVAALPSFNELLASEK